MIEGILAVFSPVTFFLVLAGCFLGIIFGAIPGLSATMAVALCLPLTYSLASSQGIPMLIALYIGGISGGLISAILIRIPGTPASIATVWDGGEMARKGQPGRALGIAITYSFFGTMFSTCMLALISPQIAQFALKFGPWEYFGVIFFALTLISSLSEGNMGVTLAAGLSGLCIGMVGAAPYDGVIRFTFGITGLNGGFTLLPVMIGAFAITEIIDSTANKTAMKVQKIEFKIKGVGFSFQEFRDQFLNMLRSACIGTGIGILPAIGSSTSNILSYVAARSSSRNPEKFGTGCIDGIIASETANNATIGGALIPLLALGIPGDGVTAMLLGGLMIQGIVPGPLMFVNYRPIVNIIIAALLISGVLVFVIQLFATKLFVRLLAVPKNVLMPVVACLCAVGAYASNSQIFDIYVMVGFGFVGYLFRRLKIPVSPMILGYILENYMETYLRRGLSVAGNDISVIMKHPIAVFCIVIGLGSMVWRIASNGRKKRQAAG